jgi:protein-L-isoaspartate(D-aspartate) O-methyltransferase
MRRRGGWAQRQLLARGIRDERVLAAMARVPRELFVPEEAREHAYDDAALLLPYGQTISQPYVVAVICEALELAGGERVLDVGTGSGYQAAVLAELAAEVVSIERIPELAEQARRNLEASGHAGRVEVLVGDGALGVPDRAPYGGIAVAAAAPGVPGTLYEQLGEGGRLVLPVGRGGEQFLEVVHRSPAGPETRPLIPVRFVPLLSDSGAGFPNG